MMKEIKIFLILLVLFISISAVSAEGNFTSLQEEIDSSTDSIEITQDYVYDDETDFELDAGILINKSNYVINGNGYTIDGSNQARIFSILSDNVTISNINLINGNGDKNPGGSIFSLGSVTLNNVTFKHNYGAEGGAIFSMNPIVISNSAFTDNIAKWGGNVYCLKDIAIFNSTFANSASAYAAAIYSQGNFISIINSVFENLHANETAGAIGLREANEIKIINCTFINATANKNAGAVYIDFDLAEESEGTLIVNSTFINSNGEFGGALVQLMSNLTIMNSTFINNTAEYDGGAIYTSHTNIYLENTSFNSNKINYDYLFNGGAIYCDMADFTSISSTFTNNTKNAIYAYDSNMSIIANEFEKNLEAVHCVFGEKILLKDNEYNEDILILNDTNYQSVVNGNSMKLELINNTINVEALPARFDLRDWGWVSSVKNQAGMGACWTFGMTGSLESALLKAANIATDFSENNMQNTMLKYSIYGSTKIVEGGANCISTGYLLSWLGAFTQDADTYDEVGKISPVITTQNDIHIQDVMFTPNNEIPNGTQLKLAILKYGSIDVSFYGQASINEVNHYYNPETHAHYVNESIQATHAVSIIGWDDNYDASNFLITPPGNGAWIVKNSYGTEWGENGFFYISYYDKTLLKSVDVTTYATSIIIENTEPYNKNYQYALIWEGDFQSGNQNVSYMNVFEALDDDSIAAVGTYFDKKGMDYTVEIYVNDELKLTQTGVSPYYGYQTIKLDEYIAIKEGDVFKAVITSKTAPTVNLTFVRSHYSQNLSYISFDGEPMKDSYDLGYITCLKVYTVADSNKTNTTNTFTELERLINASGQYLTLDDDYSFYNETDNNTGVLINKDNFVLNGNGHILDAKNLSRIFNITANNITLKDLVLINGNAQKGGAIYARGSLTLNNVTFINNYAKTEGGAVGLYGNVTLNCDNTDFTDNYAEAGSAIYVEKGKLNLYNAEVSSKIFNKYSQIAALRHSVINIENATFANTSSSYSPALYLRNTKTSIINSKFYNLRGDITAGAIGVRFGGEIYIKNCEFINTTSSKNAGAVYADIAGEGEGGYLTIIDTVFKDTYSDFGGALLQLGGDLFLNNTEFINGHARYNGGSVYLSYVNGAVNNCTFDSNSVDVIEGYPTYGGAILLDMGSYNISESKFFNNNASAGAAIYAYDSSYTISNSIFENNTNPIYSVFDKQAIIDETNIFINDNNISTNNTFYATIMVGQGMQLTLINNTINVTTLPSRYDSRDWGWVSPVRAQGWMGSCWTFGMTGALESALLKATGLRIDLSENNMQDTVIKYSIYGDLDLVEGGLNTVAASYLLSWLGAFTQDLDSYDEMGKISPVITTTQDIHVQDVIFIANDEVPNGTKLKEAIMKYGSINVNYYGQSQYDEVSLYYNTETYAQYVDVPTKQNHAVTVVGWDDNFPKEKFLATPPGDGAWIVKNSWGPEWGENGYLYVSYYDQSFVQCGPDELNGHATAVILENTVPYNKNYQYVVTWDGGFLPGAETVSYMNVFEALDDDLIAGVGTFFQEGDDNYTVEIYVNDELKLTQNGVTPYMGYHTIKLNEYIPVKEGDVFKAVITTKNIPFMRLDTMRTHYTSNISFVSIDGTPWMDSYSEGVIAVLKVYTLPLAIYTHDLVKIYKNDSQFDANIGVANETVTFEINGVNYTRTSNENGTAKMTINLGPGNYAIKTTFNGTTVENTITVLPTLIAENLVKYYRNASQFYISLIDGEGNAVTGKNITMNINGVFYDRLTNENGTAKLNINLEPGEYILTAIDPLTGLMMSYNITVLPTLNATDLEMKYRDGSKFMVSVLDGQGKPLANAKVTFNINGVFYTRTSDSEGIAKLNINLMAGKYIITSEYDRLRISNTITIKD
ncbi:C1 family peptidase [Methanobrevibacter sp.]|uniref:C1 family peptidase n=1 Tax=Methanobrevibacter sp. TaxID=66852 RepID=UPI00388E35C4